MSDVVAGSEAGPGQVVGVIPGGGSGQRLAPLPCSKELLPLGFRATPQGPRPKVIANYLVDALREARVEQVYWLIDRSKTDIVQYFGGGAEFGVQLAYAPTEGSPSVVHTLVSAASFLRGRHVLFGFPDIVFEPPGALAALRRRLFERGADVVLGAVPAPPEIAADRVRVGPDGRALEIRIKPPHSAWPDVWILAAWAPSFTSFLERWLPTRARSGAASGSGASELYLGHAIQAAIEAGMSIEVETFQDGSFIDVGTAPGLARALRRYGTVGALESPPSPAGGAAALSADEPQSSARVARAPGTEPG
jgi:glucose-1-phosphate thymidylyltransferase